MRARRVLPLSRTDQFSRSISGYFHVAKHAAGQIIKMGARSFGEMVQQMSTDADNFGVSFPANASPEAKAVLLGAVFLIDFMFFESSGGAGGGYHDD